MDYWLAQVTDPGVRLDVLVDMLGHAERNIRLNAARYLAEFTDGRAVAALLEAALNDPDVQVRQRAAVSLGEMGSPSAVAELIAAAGREDSEERAVEALAHVKDTAGTLLSNLAWPLRLAVNSRLARIRLERARGRIRRRTSGGAVGGAIGYGLGMAAVSSLSTARAYWGRGGAPGAVVQSAIKIPLHLMAGFICRTTFSWQQ